MKKSMLYSAVAAALVITSGVAYVGPVVDEVEPNNLLSTPQALTIGSDGTVTVNGIMGIVSSIPAERFPDLDFYSFQAGENEVITVDIDGGMKTSGVSVDTYVYVFGPDLNIVDWNNQGNPVDEGSLPNGSRTFETRDARIDNLALPRPGMYYIGVTSAPRVLGNGGIPSEGTANMVNSLSMGAYTLILSGLKPQFLAIPIEVKPGNKQVSPPVNAKAKGVVPVALLSTPEFDPMSVDQKTLTFGASGDELTLANCQKNDNKDWNGDGKADLTCFFDNERANFTEQSSSGFVKGKMKNGRQFQGRGTLKTHPKLEKVE